MLGRVCCLQQGRWRVGHVEVVDKMVSIFSNGRGIAIAGENARYTPLPGLEWPKDEVSSVDDRPC